MIPIHLCTTGHRFKQTLYKKILKPEKLQDISNWIPNKYKHCTTDNDHNKHFLYQDSTVLESALSHHTKNVVHHLHVSRVNNAHCTVSKHELWVGLTLEILNIKFCHNLIRWYKTQD